MKNQNIVQLDQLIPAKISLPPRRTGTIRRSRLFDMLGEGLNRRLTLVSAPAGYGKTTLVSDWLATQNLSVAWLSLTKEDNQMPVFISYLLSSLKNVYPPIGGYLDAFIRQEQPANMTSFLVPVMNEIDRSAPALIFVLDDYHLIQNPKIHELIHFLLQNSTGWANTENPMQHGCHPILISRNDPPLPLSKWRIHEEILEIRAAHLKFSLDETEAFLKIIYKEDIKKEYIRRLSESTEGWVTGLQLAALTLNAHRPNPSGNDLSEININNQYLIDYLMDEVIRNLPKEIQTFLLQTSILDHMNSDLCDQIRNKQDSQRILEWLVHENLFIIPLDDQQGWYRYHQLFLDVLTQRQYLLGKETLNKSHCRAAGWLEKKGYFPEALHHWLAADNVAEAARMMAEISPSLLNTSQFMLLRQLLESFPNQAFLQYPWLDIYRAWSYSIVKEDSLDYWLNLALQGIETVKGGAQYPESEIMEMQGNILAIRALHEARFGDNEKTIAYAKTALNQLPDKALNVRGLVLIAITKTFLRNSDLDQAINSAMQALSLSRNGGNLSGVAEALYLIGNILQTKGNLKAAWQYYQETLSLMKSQPENGLFYSHLSTFCLAGIELEWNHLLAAEEIIQENYAKRNFLGANDKVAACLIRLDGCLKLNQMNEAEEIVKEVEPYIEHPLITAFVKSELIGCLLKYYSLCYRFQIGKRIIAEHQIDCISPNDPLRQPELIGLVYFYWKTNEINSEMDLLDKLLPELEKKKRFDDLIHVQTLYAMVLYQMGEIQKALHLFSSALENGLPEGYFWTYASFGKPVLQLISDLIQSHDDHPGAEPDLPTLRQISSVISQRNGCVETPHPIRQMSKSNPARSPQPIPDPLTKQEKRVLQYLCIGIDNKAIACELGVSNNTIKTHIASIYGKLGAHNRVEAVNHAKELMLL
jgi:LuxR family maltose regulon positive regulatory protein